MEYYQAIVDSATSVDNPFQPLKNILSHLAAGNQSGLEPILIHCSLGKDRTGVICALILNLCGVEDRIVAHEYALTALGSIEDKIASIIAEIRPHGPGISEQEKRFFGSRLVMNLDHLAKASSCPPVANGEAEWTPCKVFWNGLEPTAGWREEC